MIKTYEHYEKEYTALRCAAAALEMASPNGTVYRVEDTWYDFGAGMMWTSIIGYMDDRSWQVLCPRDHALIVSCDLDSIAEAVRNIRGSKYFPDK